MNQIKYTKNLLFERMQHLNPDFKLIKEENENNTLTEIDINKAKELFNQGITIYIQDTEGIPDSHHTVFLLNKNYWDGSMNIFTAGQKPIEYGFDNIINWINEKKRNDFNLKFYTLFSNKALIIDDRNNNSIKANESTNIDEAIKSPKAHETFNNIIAFIRKSAENLNDDELYEVHEELKKWFNSLV